MSVARNSPILPVEIRYLVKARMGNRTNYMTVSGTVGIPDKTYGTALTAPQDVIERAILPFRPLVG